MHIGIPRAGIPDGLTRVGMLDVVARVWIPFRSAPSSERSERNISLSVTVSTALVASSQRRMGAL